MIKETLENELKALEPKIQRARDNNDFGTYKNLILAYKEVLHLIGDVEKSGIEYSDYKKDEIVASRYSGNFVLQKRKDIVILDYINTYSLHDDKLILDTQVINKDILMNFKKNQFKSYILTHEDYIRNTDQMDSSVLKKYKILSSNYSITSKQDGAVRYSLLFKIKPIISK